MIHKSKVVSIDNSRIILLSPFVCLLNFKKRTIEIGGYVFRLRITEMNYSDAQALVNEQM